ncbi:D-2-hydroxyacid dehydrogenase [Halobacillus shinanisalinarum]|uniref:D-2-hydroxyacid dehydrogenase n=1 Tax=Halobacillus shinanisalinarum TaxID=2932258 RepID=A0ABY4H0V7_9BACI|nr:D-2-hydroxyacid dehydrogenase [Halobacillus shinanisalinarum]UOQ92632.1 D-2-hydroxyacid dehydrogenase [Halobacillus shinanisalinarum]
MQVVSVIKRVPDEIKERLVENFGEVDFYFCHGMKEGRQHLKEADVLITFGEDVTPELIADATRLKWIMVLSAGMDQMPFEDISRRNILVTNVRGIHAIPMAEYAISMVLQVSRQAKALVQLEQGHQWNRRTPMKEINGQTMVLLGTGAIAQETARLAKTFRMKTVGVSKSGRTKPYFDETYSVDRMKEALSHGDVVVAVLPSTEETTYLLTEEHFRLMPSHAIFLNMGRGDLVASHTILQAIKENQISHAVLDVFEEEPLPESHPFWEEERVTVTPHLSGITPQYLPRGFEIFERNLQSFLNKKEDMENLIDPKRGY